MQFGKVAEDHLEIEEAVKCESSGCLINLIDEINNAII